MFAEVYTALALANTTRGIKSTEPDLYVLSCKVLIAAIEALNVKPNE